MHLELLGTMKTNNNNRKDLKMNNNDTTLSPMVVPLTASIYGALIYGIYLIFMVTIWLNWELMKIMSNTIRLTISRLLYTMTPMRQPS